MMNGAPIPFNFDSGTAPTPSYGVNVIGQMGVSSQSGMPYGSWPSGPQNRLPYKFKQEACKYFAEGNCRKGSRCTYHHDGEDMKPVKDENWQNQRTGDDMNGSEVSRRSRQPGDSRNGIYNEYPVQTQGLPVIASHSKNHVPNPVNTMSRPSSLY